ncbi:MAG: hypothetical protein WA655_02830 [Candidatus Korobacteraceae bacterium]
MSSFTVLVNVIGGAMLMSIGFLGEYVGKLYEQSKNRPLYLVSRTLNVHEAEMYAPVATLSRVERR